jgi:hypothetical protein
MAFQGQLEHHVSRIAMKARIAAIYGESGYRYTDIHVGPGCPGQETNDSLPIDMMRSAILALRTAFPGCRVIYREIPDNCRRVIRCIEIDWT